jgi:glyoxylase-like metal-dependent hydrolase (beta-lactamase superfamily II)
MPKALDALSLLTASLLLAVRAGAQINTVQNIAPDVYFHEGDPKMGPTCNNGWVVMDDYVVVVDANYPAGAKVVAPKIQAMTAKPIRFVIDTHFHPDHSTGNEVWAELGAIPVAHVATLDQLKAMGAEQWRESAKSRPDMAGSTLKLPSLAYTDELVFDDGRHRVELHWLGVGHTKGDTLVWLPKEKILFTGDVCVNGSFNYLHDSNVDEWIKLLEKAKNLGAVKVCPGHGPMGGPEIIADQQEYFIQLQRGVKAFVDAGKSPAEVSELSPSLASRLRAIGNIARYVPTDFWFKAQVEKVYAELGGKSLPK